MKLNTNAAPAKGTGFTNTSDFKMDMNAKAARVLSDTLYEDKHGSIIRELCSNAFDAHKMVGKEDEPFDLTLPDAFSSMLKIRDYGPGISPEDIETVYSTYFASTKDSDNDAVGMFGLGSKTPFSLTDSFTVVSIHKGVKRVYSAYMNEGMPCISMFGEPEKTDEPNGLEVSVSVDRKDRSAFYDAVLKQLRFFPVKPNVTPKVEWPEIEDVLIEVDGFKYFKHNHDLLRGFFIKTGPVAYSVDFDKILEYYRYNDIPVPSLVNFMNNLAGDRSYAYGSFCYYGSVNTNTKGAVLDMPIGTVEVTPSREGLSYSDTTLRNIVNAIENVSSKLFDTVKQGLHDAYNKGYGAFIDYYNNLDSMMLDNVDVEYIEKHFDPFTVHNSLLSIKMPEKFVGIEVKTYHEKYSLSGSGPELLKTIHPANQWESDPANYEKDSNDDIVFEDFENTEQCRSALKWIVGTDNLLFLQDEKYAFAVRSYNYYKTNPSGKAFYVINTSKCEGTLKEFEDYVSPFIKSEIVYISDTPKPSKNSSGGFSTTGGKKRSWFDLTNLSRFSAESLFYETLYKLRAESEFDLTCDDIKDEDEDSIVFFTTFNNRLERPDSGTYIARLILNYVQRYTDDVEMIIAVPRGQRKKYDKMKSTIHVDEFVKKYGDEIRKAVREDINKLFLNEYNQRISHIISYRSKIFNVINYEDFNITDSDFDSDNWKTNVVSILYRMDEHSIASALKELNAEDLYKELESNKDKWKALKSIQEAEQFLSNLNVDFVSFKNKIDALRNELINGKNAGVFLTNIVKSPMDFNYNTRIADPWRRDENILHLGDLAENLIKRIA